MRLIATQTKGLRLAIARASRQTFISPSRSFMVHSRTGKTPVVRPRAVSSDRHAIRPKAPRARFAINRSSLALSIVAWAGTAHESSERTRYSLSQNRSSTTRS